MLHAEARRSARRNGAGEYIPFAAQDPARWDWERIAEAEELLRRASSLGSVGRYQLEGALHRRTSTGGGRGRTNWPAVVQLYDALWAMTGSPVVAINRAWQWRKSRMPAAGLGGAPRSRAGCAAG